MNGIEHSFPLPETEAHKLDEVKEEITHPSFRKVTEATQTRRWPLVILGAVTGVVLGLWLNSRD